MDTEDVVQIISENSGYEDENNDKNDASAAKSISNNDDILALLAKSKARLSVSPKKLEVEVSTPKPLDDFEEIEEEVEEEIAEDSVDEQKSNENLSTTSKVEPPVEMTKSNDLNSDFQAEEKCSSEKDIASENDETEVETASKIDANSVADFEEDLDDDELVITQSTSEDAGEEILGARAYGEALLSVLGDDTSAPTKSGAKFKSEFDDIEENINQNITQLEDEEKKEAAQNNPPKISIMSPVSNLVSNLTNRSPAASTQLASTKKVATTATPNTVSPNKSEKDYAKLPPQIVNRLLHEEAMYAAMKAAQEGKDSHKFDFSNLSEIKSELQKIKEAESENDGAPTNDKLSSGYYGSGVVSQISSWLKTQRANRTQRKLQREADHQLEILNSNVTDEKLLSEAQAEYWLQNNFDWDDPNFTDEDGNKLGTEDTETQMVPLAIEPELIPEDSADFCHYILAKKIMEEFQNNFLPTSAKFSRWKRFYSLNRDGDSFETFLRKVSGQQRTLLVIKTTKGDIFGGFADSEWNSTSQNAASGTNVAGKYYGSAQGFLFKLVLKNLAADNKSVEVEVDNEQNTKRDDHSEMEQYEIKQYKWTGLNRYVQLCDSANKKIIMGGGGDDDTSNSGFGLCIERDFSRGSTGPCETFKNERLTSDENDNDEGLFEIMQFEAWGFTSYQF